MALIIADRVKETSTTTGTGPLALLGGMAGFIAFADAPGIAVGDYVPYAVQAVNSAGAPTGEWEVGLGVYSASNELTRLVVDASSNANAVVDLAAGTKQVWLDFSATRLKQQGAAALARLTNTPFI